eukprot:s5693_g6.t1
MPATPLTICWQRLPPQCLLMSKAALPEGLELPEGENFTPHPLLLPRCSKRSASPALSSLLKRSLASILGADICQGLAFAKSQDNFADDPTRHLPCRALTEDLPAWYGFLALGDTGPLDAWLAKQADLLAAREAETFKPEDIERVLPSPAARPAPVTSDSGASLFPRALFEPRLGYTWVLRKLLCCSSRPSLATGAFLPPASSTSLCPVFWTCAGRLQVPAPSWGAVGSCALCDPRRGCRLAFWGASADPSAPCFGGLFPGPGCALTCETFSVAWQPPIRSALAPGGLPHLPQGVFDRTVPYNKFARWAAAVRDALPASSAFWCHRPDGSFVWRMPEWASFGDPAALGVCRVDLCRFGAPWSKRTRVAANFVFQAFCQCTGPHRRLRGRSLPGADPLTEPALTSLGRLPLQRGSP